MDVLSTEMLDTRLLPPGDRWELWTDVASRASAPQQQASEHAADFQARAKVIDLAGIRLSRFRYQSLTSRRTPRLIRQGDPEVYQLALTLSGTSSISALRRQTTVPVADFTLVDWGRPHEVVHTSVDGGLASAVTATIPRAMLRLDHDKVDQLAAAAIPGSTGLGALVAQHLHQITRHPEQFRPSDAPRLAALTLDLISAMLAGHLDAEHALTPDTRQQAMLSRIEAFVDRHLHDPTLSPQVVADAHHISVRSLHRLFAGSGETIGERIRRQRLERCRRDLADPVLRQRPVQQIGARWGFTDKAHFSRAFRAAYGLSPQAYRAALALAPEVNSTAPKDNQPPAYWAATG